MPPEFLTTKAKSGNPGASSGEFFTIKLSKYQKLSFTFLGQFHAANYSSIPLAYQRFTLWRSKSQ